MPLYSYRCDACSAEFESLVSSEADPACPTCGATTLTRMISRIAPEGKSKSLLKSARSQAAKEGHLSNYSKSELR